MTADDVLQELARRAWRFGAAVFMSPDAYIVSGGRKLGGYFEANEGEQPILAVATGRPVDSWLGLLLHEYSHLTQWAENSPEWRAYDPNGRLEAWLAGEKVRDIRRVIGTVVALEADCERRAIRLAKELQAPLNLDNYIRGANGYIHFHGTVLKTRKWYRDGMGPYTNPRVLAAANSTFDTDFSKTPKALADALMECI